MSRFATLCYVALNRDLNSFMIPSYKVCVKQIDFPGPCELPVNCNLAWLHQRARKVKACTGALQL